VGDASAQKRDTKSRSIRWPAKVRDPAEFRIGKKIIRFRAGQRLDVRGHRWTRAASVVLAVFFAVTMIVDTLPSIVIEAIDLEG